MHLNRYSYLKIYKSTQYYVGAKNRKLIIYLRKVTCEYDVTEYKYHNGITLTLKINHKTQSSATVTKFEIFFHYWSKMYANHIFIIIGAKCVQIIYFLLLGQMYANHISFHYWDKMYAKHIIFHHWGKMYANHISFNYWSKMYANHMICIHFAPIMKNYVI